MYFYRYVLKFRQDSCQFLHFLCISKDAITLDPMHFRKGSRVDRPKTSLFTFASVVPAKIKFYVLRSSLIIAREGSSAFQSSDLASRRCTRPSDDASRTVTLSAVSVVHWCGRSKPMIITWWGGFEANKRMPVLWLTRYCCVSVLWPKIRTVCTDSLRAVLNIKSFADKHRASIGEANAF